MTSGYLHLHAETKTFLQYGCYSFLRCCFYLRMIEKLVLIKSSTAVTTNEGFHLFLECPSLNLLQLRNAVQGRLKINRDWPHST